MTATVTYSAAGPTGQMISGVDSVSLTSLPTSAALILVVQWDYGANVAAISGANFSLSTDGTPDDYTAQYSAANGHGTIMAYWDNCTTASQTLSLTNSGTGVECQFDYYTVTGHDTAAPFAVETGDASATTLNFTFGTTGNTAFVRFAATVSTAHVFGEGTWTNMSGWKSTYTCTNLTAGTKSIGVTNASAPYAYIIEIKAAGGGGGGVPKSTKFLMTGIG